MRRRNRRSARARITAAWILAWTAAACTTASPFGREETPAAERPPGPCVVRVENHTAYTLRFSYRAGVHQGSLPATEAGGATAFAVACDAERIFVVGVGPFRFGEGRLVYRTDTAPDPEAETLIRITEGERSR